MRIGLASLLAHLTRRRGLALPAALLAAAALAAPAQAATSSQPARPQPAAQAAALLGSSPVAGPGAASPAPDPAGSFQPLPSLPVNSCQDSTLPRRLRHQLPGPGRPERLRFRQPVGDRLGGQLLRALQLPVGLLLRPRRPVHLQAGQDDVLRRDVPFGVYNYGLAAGQAPAPGSVHWTHGQRLPARADHLVHPQRRRHLDHRLRRQADDRRQPVELVYTRVR